MIEAGDLHGVLEVADRVGHRGGVQERDGIRGGSTPSVAGHILAWIAWDEPKHVAAGQALRDLAAERGIQFVDYVDLDLPLPATYDAEGGPLISSTR